MTLEILDEKGGLVRRYSSADAPPKPDPAKLSTAPEWVSRPRRSRRRPACTASSGRCAMPPPGRGRALGRRRVGAARPLHASCWRSTAQRLTQPLTVAPDPRITLPAEAYAAQFALARRIEEAQARVERPRARRTAR